MKRPLLFVGALLIRYVAGCSGDDNGDDPRFAPFLKSDVSIDAVAAADEQDRAIDIVVVAETRKKTYHCSEDTTVGSCAPSQDPDDACSGSAPDFGPHWDEEAIAEVPIASVTAESCAVDGTCTTYDAKLIRDVEVESYAYSYQSASTHRWERTYRVVVPNDPSNACPRIHVIYADGTAPATVDLDRRCVSAPPSTNDAGADPNADAADAGPDGS